MQTKVERPTKINENHTCTTCGTWCAGSCHVCEMIRWTQEQSFRAGIWEAARQLDELGHHELANRIRYPEEVWTELTLNFEKEETNG